MQVEEVNVKHYQDENDINKAGKDYFNNLLNHEIITKSTDGTLVKHYNSVLIRLNKINQPVKNKFLIKFSEAGTYTLKLDADYKIMKKEIYDDTSNLKFNSVINIEVKQPFTHKFEFNSETYMSLQQHKIYCVDKQIKLNLSLINNLEYEFELMDVIVNKHNSNDLELETYIKKVLSANKDISFKIQKQSEFVIPFVAKSTEPFSGALGHCKILWRDNKLKLFDESLYNETEVSLPEINIKNYDVALSYSIPQTITQESVTTFKILINNTTEEFKRIVFLIDNSNNFVTSGFVKKKILLYPNEVKELVLNLIPISYGRLKLPLFKIMEYPLPSTNYENKIYSVYYVPDSISLKDH